MILKEVVHVTQGGADTTAYGTAALPDLDGKTGRKISGIQVQWVNGYSAAAADHVLKVILQTQTGAVAAPTDNEYLCAVMWGQQNTAGVAVTLGFEPVKNAYLREDRVTVQDLVVAAVSTTTGLTNEVYVDVFYELVKLTELEYLRMLAGGA
jgi:hypothetical protein